MGEPGRMQREINIVEYKEAVPSTIIINSFRILIDLIFVERISEESRRSKATGTAFEAFEKALQKPFHNTKKRIQI